MAGGHLETLNECIYVVVGPGSHFRFPGRHCGALVRVKGGNYLSPFYRVREDMLLKRFP